MLIGIITIHRLYNYGSNLQAFALQHYIEEKFGYRVEIIDYLFPNKYHKNSVSCLKRIRRFWGQVKSDIFQRKLILKYRFKKFQKAYYHLTPSNYKSKDSLERAKLKYDLFITGSDQVWNPNTLKNDPIMFCSFAPAEIRRISFGASFSTTNYPIEYKESAKILLDKYSHIGVREKSALNVLKSIGVKSTIPQVCTCDPTLLLDKKDYHQLSVKSRIHYEKKYILVYKLGYSYNPEPAMSSIIEEAKKVLNIDVLVVGHPLRFVYKGKAKFLEGVGPHEFLWLFEHATYVITSSFHGTVFSLIYRKPFASIIPGKENEDNRILDFLKICHLEENAFSSSSKTCPNNFSASIYTPLVESSIKKYIDFSQNFLDRALKNEL